MGPKNILMRKILILILMFRVCPFSNVDGGAYACYDNAKGGTSPSSQQNESRRCMILSCSSFLPYHTVMGNNRGAIFRLEYVIYDIAAPHSF